MILPENIDSIDHLGYGAFYGCGLEFDNPKLYKDHPDSVLYDDILFDDHYDLY